MTLEEIVYKLLCLHLPRTGVHLAIQILALFCWSFRSNDFSFILINEIMSFVSLDFNDLASSFHTNFNHASIVVSLELIVKYAEKLIAFNFLKTKELHASSSSAERRILHLSHEISSIRGRLVAINYDQV